MQVRRARNAGVANLSVALCNFSRCGLSFFSFSNRIPGSEGRGPYMRASGRLKASVALCPLGVSEPLGHYALASCPSAGRLSCLGTAVVIECVLDRNLPVRRLDMEDSLICSLSRLEGRRRGPFSFFSMTNVLAVVSLQKVRLFVRGFCGPGHGLRPEGWPWEVAD